MVVTKRKKSVGNNRIKKAMAEAPQKHVHIEPLNVGVLSFHLVGTSPLVTHNFDDKSRKEMLEGQTKKGKKTQRKPRSPVDEYLQAYYWVGKSAPPAPTEVNDGVPSYSEAMVKAHLKKSTFGIPITAFKNAMISACRNTELVMTHLKQQIFVVGTVDPEWAIIKGVSHMDNRICRLKDSNKTPIERFRPMWINWETDIKIEWDKNKLSADQLATLLSIAGYYVGVCEGRPERSALGWGRWAIED